MRRRLRRRHPVNAELDITAFMNLMVILVPFLLITAVFSRITVLDLYLPPDSSSANAAVKQFRLEVVVRDDRITLLEASSGLKRDFQRNKGEPDLTELKQALYKLKEKYPSKNEATILAEANIDYDILVQVMDAIRMKPVETEGRLRLESLFPGISIGDAPEHKK